MGLPSNKRTECNVIMSEGVNGRCELVNKETKDLLIVHNATKVCVHNIQLIECKSFSYLLKYLYIFWLRRLLRYNSLVPLLSPLDHRLRCPCSRLLCGRGYCPLSLVKTKTQK